MPFEIRELKLPEVLEVGVEKFGDDRGFFSEVFRSKVFADRGLELDWVQDNHSYSTHKGVLRGLHFQRPPYAQDKLVRVTRGSILDVAVDIRKGSPTYAQWVSLVVSHEKWNQIFVPKGFAHGFITREPDTEVLYKVSHPYAPDHEAAIRFDDPDIGVDWQLGNKEPWLSEKDRNAPLLRDQTTEFPITHG